MNHTFSYATLILSSLAVAAPKDGFEPTPALVEVWAQEWRESMDEIVGELIEGFEEPLLMTLDPQDRQTALGELRGVFYSEVTWDVVSESVISSITAKCDSDLLTKAEPYLIQKADSSAIEHKVLREYASCYSDAMFHSKAAAMYAISAAAKNSRDIFSRYERQMASYQRIAPSITTVAVERQYGQLLDEVISLHQISDEEQRRRKGEALEATFAKDPTVLYVSLEDPGYPHAVYGEAFHYYQSDMTPSGKSCRGASPPEQQGLIRCSWDGDGFGKENVIRYTRRFSIQGENLKVVVEFDYAELLRALHD